MIIFTIKTAAKMMVITSRIEDEDAEFNRIEIEIDSHCARQNI